MEFMSLIQRNSDRSALSKQEKAHMELSWVVAAGLYFIFNRGWNMIGGGKRGPGSIQLDPESRKILSTWLIPGGGSPDMGNISADGKELWISGRYDSEVYDVDSTTGRLIARIRVGSEPHGLCVWPHGALSGDWQHALILRTVFYSIRIPLHDIVVQLPH